jgi:hypothetical protein
MRLPGLASAALTPVFQETIHVEIGDQWTDDAPNAKGNFRFEREIRHWRSGNVLDLRRKE